MRLLDDHPAADEIEITLFGRGFGECAVVHVGQGRWIIVDSYVSEFEWTDPETDQSDVVPVALWYLERMGVHRRNVEQIVVTHFHLDHFDGVDQLHDHYTSARLLVSAALNEEVITQVYADKVARPIFGCIPGVVERAKNRKCGGPFANGLDYVGNGYARQFPGRARMTALSPVHGTITAALGELAQRMARCREDVRTLVRSQNWCSIVLHLETSAGTALLCADLETKPYKYGWKAVMSEVGQWEQLPPASLVKVGHHGSPTAEHPPMWTDLVEDGAVMALAPFENGDVSLPSESDWRRLCARGELYQATPSGATVGDSTGYDGIAEGPTGIVRARRRVGDPEWRIDLEGRAFHVNPLFGA